MGSRFHARCAAVLTVALLAGCGSTAAPAAAGRSTASSPTASAGPSPAPTPSRRKTPVNVAIFGDSQGTALFAAHPSTVARSLRLSDESISACGILRGRVASRSGERFDLIGACPNWLPAWRDAAKRVKPDVALVVIGAWDVFDLKTKSKTIVFGTSEWDAAFLTQLSAGVAALRASGAQVALAELPCYRPRKSNPRPPGWWPERGEDDRTRHVNDLLRRLTDGGHVFTVTPPAAFCADMSIGDNRKYRYDGIHYLAPGAKLWFDAVIPQLLILPS